MATAIPKDSIRSQFLQQRQALSPALWRSQSDRICHHLSHCPALIDARTVLEADDNLHPWFERMLDLYDGFARREPARAQA